MTFSILKRTKLWFAISGVFMLASILCLIIFGLRPGVDFTGGSLLEVRFVQVPEIASLRTTLANLGYTDPSVQTAGETDVLFRLENLSEEEHQTLLTALKEQYGQVDELRFDSIGPVIGKELRNRSLIGVLILLILIGLYVTWSFRKVGKPVAPWKYGVLTLVTAFHDMIIPLGVFAVLGHYLVIGLYVTWSFRKVGKPVAPWKYGVLTLVTAFHDMIIPLGVFAVLGHYLGWEVGTGFVAAILTVLGYSINDTIVVFDRTRENLLHKTHESLEVILEKSLHETLGRSLTTGIATLLTLFAIFLWGGSTTQPFALALIIGILAGTYSSIFFASPLLVVWQKYQSRE